MIRCTLAKSVTRNFRGMLGEHSITINPASAPSGFTFVYKRVPIPATLEYVRVSTKMISIGQRLTTVHLVENLLAALVSCGITDAQIMVEKSIIPSLPMGMIQFVKMIIDGGKRELPGKHPYYKVICDDIYTDGDRVVEMKKSSELIVHYIIDFPNSINVQESVFTVGENSPFEIAASRPYTELGGITSTLLKPFLPILGETFLFANPSGFVNAPNFAGEEPVKSRVIDFLASAALLGHPVQGTFNLFKSGISVNISAINQFVRSGNLHLVNSR